ncbi:MAG: hypothetical protein K1X78_15905 [Verrucomicrobiaceae bacterium]|nr:hypothetical protein [Verrucomicrobiaceae bacterium]
MKAFRQIYIAVSLTFVLGMTSCSSVYSKKVVGSDQYPKLKAFEGVWVFESKSLNGAASDGSAIRLTVGDEASGLLKAEQTSAKVNESSPSGIFVRMISGKTFLSIPQGDAKGFSFCMATHVGERSIVTIDPDLDVFARLVDSGELAGEIKRDAKNVPTSVTLDKISETTLDLLLRKGAFKYGEPLVWMKVGALSNLVGGSSSSNANPSKAAVEVRKVMTSLNEEMAKKWDFKSGLPKEKVKEAFSDLYTSLLSQNVNECPAEFAAAYKALVKTAGNLTDALGAIPVTQEEAFWTTFNKAASGNSFDLSYQKERENFRKAWEAFTEKLHELDTISKKLMSQ